MDGGPGPNVASALTGFVGPIHMKRDEKDCRVSGNGYEASQCLAGDFVLPPIQGY